ncbi:hypothetical protein TIFTF001_045353, partial [Ficus carica]
MAATTVAAQSSLPAGCDNQYCGDLKVPYPFGMTDDCALENKFFINCLKSGNDSTPYLMKKGNLVVKNISLDGEMEIMNYLAKDCYSQNGTQGISTGSKLWLIDLFTISYTKNKFFAIGCDTYAKIEGSRANNSYTTGCLSSCQKGDNLTEPCSGVGCCQISLPRQLVDIYLTLTSFYSHQSVLDFNPCSYAFVVKDGEFNFSDTSFEDLNKTEKLPMVINWSIGNVSCEVARKFENYSCKANSECVSGDRSGYLCRCLLGYEGNPYHPHGCTDIDECKVKPEACLNGTCINIPGDFNCSCHEGYTAENKTTCKPKPNPEGGSSRALLLIIPL